MAASSFCPLAENKKGKNTASKICPLGEKCRGGERSAAEQEAKQKRQKQKDRRAKKEDAPLRERSAPDQPCGNSRKREGERGESVAVG